MSTLSAKEYKCFEDIKRVRPDGSEYWAARELAPVLDYAKWENFYKVIKRAMIACENSGRSTLECFPEVRKTSPMPNGGVKDILDYELSRYACYLIVQNGDPRKEVIALGQTYFAIQTYRQEVADRFNQLDEDRGCYSCGRKFSLRTLSVTVFMPEIVLTSVPNSRNRNGSFVGSERSIRRSPTGIYLRRTISVPTTSPMIMPTAMPMMSSMSYLQNDFSDFYPGQFSRYQFSI